MFRMLSLVALVMLTACAKTPHADLLENNPSKTALSPKSVPMSEKYLAGVWQLQDNPIDEVKPLMLRFGDGRVSVMNGCNHLTASYTITDHRLSVASPISTRMLCEPSLMAVDKLAGELLAGVLTLQRHSEDSSDKVSLNIELDGRSYQFIKVK